MTYRAQQDELRNWKSRFRRIESPRNAIAADGTGEGMVGADSLDEANEIVLT
jgi:hypothetical protein